MFTTEKLFYVVRNPFRPCYILKFPNNDGWAPYVLDIGYVVSIPVNSRFSLDPDKQYEPADTFDADGTVDLCKWRKCRGPHFNDCMWGPFTEEIMNRGLHCPCINRHGNCGIREVGHLRILEWPGMEKEWSTLDMGMFYRKEKLLSYDHVAKKFELVDPVDIATVLIENPVAA